MKLASTKKSLLIVIFLLVIIDVVILFFFVSKNKPEDSRQSERKEGGMTTMLKTEAGFSTEQLAQYQTLREQQFEEVKPMFSKIRKSKDNFYSLLYVDSLPDSTLNALSDSIALNQKVLDLQMLSYFRKIRAISTQEQLPKFDSSISKVLVRMTGRQGRSRSKSDSTNEMKQSPNNNK